MTKKLEKQKELKGARLDDLVSKGIIGGPEGILGPKCGGYDFKLNIIVEEKEETEEKESKKTEQTCEL